VRKGPWSCVLLTAAEVLRRPEQAQNTVDNMLSRTLRGVAAIVLVSSVSAASLPSGFGSLPCRLRGGGPDEDPSGATSMLRRSSSQEAINQFQRELRGGEPAVEKPAVKEPEPTVVSSFFSVFESKQKPVAQVAAPGETKKDALGSEPVASIPTAKAAVPVATSVPASNGAVPVVEAKPVPVAAPDAQVQVPSAPSQPSTAPHGVQATAAPTSVQATAAPTSVQATAAPTGVEATTAPTGVEATTAPTGVQATAAPTSVQATAAPTESNKQPVGAPPPASTTPQTNAQKIASARPAVVATAMGLGQASPRAQLDIEEARLLVEADKFLDEVRTEPIDTADTTRVQSVVKKNRLFVMRCKSVLEKTVDSFTRKQVESRIASLEAAYEQSSTVSHKKTRESLTLARSPSMECLLGSSDEEDFDAANPARSEIGVRVWGLGFR